MLEENEALKAILKGAVVTIDVGDMEKKEVSHKEIWISSKLTFTHPSDIWLCLVKQCL